jgi:hypothetical protein
MTAPMVVKGVDNLGREVTVRFGSQRVAATQPEGVKMNTRQKVCKVLGLPEDASAERVWAAAEAAGVIETAEQRRQTAAKAIRAAVAEGKLSEKSEPVWRARYERDPEGTRAELRRLTAIDPQLLAASAARRRDEVSDEDELQRRTRIALGLEAPSAPGNAHVSAAASAGQPPSLAVAKSKPLGPTSGPMGSGASDAPQAPAAKPELTRTPDGHVMWGGAPTRLSDRGTRQIFRGVDWLDVEEAERMGVTPTESLLSIHSVQSGPGFAAAKARLNEGLSGSRHLLGGASDVRGASS